MRSTTSDIIIIGGGCSGLALAYALSKASCHLSIRILESRSHYSNDRTWCFWTKSKNEWTELACQRWNKWSFQLGDEGKPIVHHGQNWFYYCLAAKDYYHFVQQSLLHNYHIKLEMNQLVSEVQYADPEQLFSDAKPEAVVKTQARDTQAKLIIDTRQPVDRQSMLYRHFLGLKSKPKKPLLILANTTFVQTKMVSDLLHTILTPNRVLLNTHDLAKVPLISSQWKHSARRKCAVSNASISHLQKRVGCLPMGMDQTTYPTILQGQLVARCVWCGFLRIQSWAARIARNFSA